MYFSSALVASLGLLGMTQAGPVAPLAARDVVSFTVEKTASGEIESFANATALGVDIFGDIPDDGVREGDHVTAEPGTKAWAWIRAQIDIDWDTVPTEQLEKRQGWANIGIGMWAQDNCQGHAAYWDNVQYNVHHYDTINYFSIGIRHRGLRSGEQLDVSRLSGSDWCGHYVNTIASPSGTGCGHVGPINCFRLWLN
ncbi:hypothetical protein SODALDRAFT_296784 [Sodiomyces alkalinus F11]|uniref:Uncharacterized protein n=1 Tax=Sodiomyces alkalinus (strain CBS 110278 / VKM F-3762 / F11) TaxID=1314773 RepID=A0A3N2PUM6_SODAK|nr:hypothetical protein SODALDRAFT_296784 [Sodiomyces alkalinus F11]ROT38217.1 hypothetical protein SODALDRAFT_296784 [Sodiomyces alkalinus F11]